MGGVGAGGKCNICSVNINPGKRGGIIVEE